MKSGAACLLDTLVQSLKVHGVTCQNNVILILTIHIAELCFGICRTDCIGQEY